MNNHTNGIVRKLISEAIRADDINCFLGDVGRLLSQEPWGIERIFLSLNALHPAVRARTYLWQMQDDCSISTEWPHGLENRPGYYDSPDWHVHQTQDPLRIQKLEDQKQRKCDLYGTLHQQGFRDYLMVPLLFSNGNINTLSIATRNPRGFSDKVAEDFLQTISPAMNIILERYAASEALGAALHTYVGASAAQEILSGHIVAGQGEMVQGAILFADLHDFTAHSANLGPSQTVELLNDYFDALVQPIEQNGGQVLKFIGDAVLAFFPAAPGRQPGADPRSAIDEIRNAMDELNRKRLLQNQPELTHAVCAHFGEVVYGNVGSRERLDYTIIGGPVNIASRGVELAATLGSQYLFTGEFVKHFGADGLESLGYHPLRSVNDLEEMYRYHQS